MSKNEKDIIEIQLSNEQITSINPYEVVAFKIAGDGAMGEPDTQNMKQEEYRKLCDYVKRAYKELEAENIRMHAGTEITYMREYDQCDEINLWTYWQGRGVYNPKIMLIGQDWGCPFEHSGNGLDVRLRASKEQPIKPEDDRNCHYFDDMQTNKIDFKTDANLAELFRSLNLGYDNLLHVRYDDLFFTNICLGYRNSGNSGNFRKSWITDIEKYAYPKLVEILQPEVIICLGRNTYESFLLAMCKKDNRNKSPFNDFIDVNNKSPFELNGTPVFVFAHCGSMGTLNRNDKKNSSLDIQKRDWQHLLKFING